MWASVRTVRDVAAPAPRCPEGRDQAGAFQHAPVDPTPAYLKHIVYEQRSCSIDGREAGGLVRALVYLRTNRTTRQHKLESMGCISCQDT